jgi:hypothetical protein
MGDVKYEEFNGYKKCKKCGCYTAYDDFEKYYVNGIPYRFCKYCCDEMRRLYQFYNKDKRAVQQKLRYAVRKGVVEKKRKCEVCGSEKKVEAHHWNYSKPLEVQWLCYYCHSDADSLRKAYEKIQKGVS